MEQSPQFKNQCRNERNVMAIKILRAIGFEQVNILKALPKLSGVTHQEVASRIGFSRNAVTNILTCDRSNRNLQDKIAGVYGVPVEIMFPGTNNTTTANQQ